MDQATVDGLIGELVLPFADNAEGSFRDFRNDLVTAFRQAGVELRVRRIDPLTLYKDSFGSLKVNVEHRDFFGAAIDFIAGGLVQAVPAYQKTEFEHEGDGRKCFKRITFYKTGIVLEPLTLALSWWVFGFPIPIVNLLNWIGGTILGAHDDEHEWNHAFDTYVVQQLYRRGLVCDVEDAVVDLNDHLPEPPYKIQSKAELRQRAIAVIEGLCRDLSLPPEVCASGIR